MNTTKVRQSGKTIAELTFFLWGASWLSLFISAGLVLIAWFSWLRADLGYYLASSLVLSPILRSLSEAAGQAMCQRNQNTMAESLKQYVSAENAAADEDEHQHLRIAS
jgi:hypothetical protein